MFLTRQGRQGVHRRRPTTLSSTNRTASIIASAHELVLPFERRRYYFSATRRSLLLSATPSLPLLSSSQSLAVPTTPLTSLGSSRLLPSLRSFSTDTITADAAAEGIATIAETRVPLSSSSKVIDSANEANGALSSSHEMAFNGHPEHMQSMESTTPASTTITTKSKVTSPRKKSPRKKSVDDKISRDLQRLIDIKEIQFFVDQLVNDRERVLTSKDIPRFIEPLMKAASQRVHGLPGAILTDKLLIHCFSFLPPEYDPNDVHFFREVYPTLPYPTTWMYTQCMMSWQYVKEEASAHQVDRLFELMLSEYKREYAYITSPQVQQYVCELRAQPKQPPESPPTADNAPKIETATLTTVEEEEYGAESTTLNVSTTTCRSALPDLETFLACLTAWAICNDRKKPKKLYYYLLLLELNSGVFDYTENDKGRKFMRLFKLDDMRWKYQNNHTKLDMPDRLAYNMVLSTFAGAITAIDRTSLTRCSQIVRRMDALRTKLMNNEYELSQFSYQRWLYLYHIYIVNFPLRNSGRIFLSPDISHEIMTILRRIHEQQKRHDKQIANTQQPSSGTDVNTSSSSSLPDSSDPIIPSTIPDVNLFSAYGILIEALLQTAPITASIEVATAVLLAMTGQCPNPIQPDFDFKSYYFAGNSNNTKVTPGRTINTIDEDALRDRKQKKYKMKDLNHHRLRMDNLHNYRNWPRHDVISKVILEWKNSKFPNADEKVETLLQSCVVDCPDNVHFTELHQDMETWERHSPEVVEMMLYRALDNFATSFKNNKSATTMKPNGTTFAVAMRAWLKSKRADAPHRIEILLQNMISLFEREDDRHTSSPEEKTDGAVGVQPIGRDGWYTPQEVHIKLLLTSWIEQCRTGEKYSGMFGDNLYPAQHCDAIATWLQTTDWCKQRQITEACGMTLRAWAMQEFDDNDDLDDDALNAVKRAMILSNCLYSALNPETKASTSAASSKHNGLTLLPPFTCNWILEVCARPQRSIDRQIEAFESAFETFRRSNKNARSFVLMSKVIFTQVLYPSLNDTIIDRANQDVVQSDASNYAEEKNYSDTAPKVKTGFEASTEVIVELFRESCMAGMLTQEMIWNVLHVLPSAEALQELFGLSYEAAVLAIQLRDEGMATTKSFWLQSDGRYVQPPSSLLVENLPRAWSANAGRV